MGAGGHNSDPLCADLERAERSRKAAERALAEAEERRKAAKAGSSQKETGGRGGLDPARFGDWEVKGIARDF